MYAIVAPDLSIYLKTLHMITRLSSREAALEERTKFLAWLHENFPEQALRYSQNIDARLIRGGRMTINNNRISYLARHEMIALLKQYYDIQ